ncbi:GAF domain-containing protein [Nostoc sp. UHCC 0302]|uniref:hybrid sensor histidine kinase/response regulator n=1 Tax=Nostoc sp. UHCC 0302 TaxID=3134896 RepID=UPI00311C92BF
MNSDKSNQMCLLSICQQKEKELQQQIEQQQLVMAMAVRIRQSLNLEEVLNTTVNEVRQFLQGDRVLIYQFQADYSGIVVVESVGDGWISVLNAQVQDTWFMSTGNEHYQQGRIQAVADIYTAGLTECHRDLLAQFQVRANLVVPILQGENLWGLLVASQCAAPRQWQSWEIDLLKQLATQIGIAIQQSQLYEQVQSELAERKQAEQKIKEQAALLDITTDAILVRDLNNQITFWNQGAESLYGWKADEILGDNADKLLCQENLPQLEIAFKQVIECSSWQGELEKVTKFGQKILVESRWILMFDEAFQRKSILTVDTDITEKKQLQAQFLRSQRLESLGTLASGIAHDLNNILTPILSSVQLLALKLPNLDGQYKQMLKIIEDNSKRAADLVKQILTFARGSDERGITLQIEHLLLEMEQIAKSTFPKSIQVTKKLPQEPLWAIKAKPTQIHQVLMNLCVNARDAMPKGGTLSIGAENLSIEQNLARINPDANVGSYVVITINDTGFGMTPLIRERIFEPFFTTKELGKGTGLGLSTVIGIVKNYGGFVTVDSQLGKGTQFQVYFPAIKPGIRGVAENVELPHGNGELILIVDDEIAILEMTKTLLEDSNYKTLTAINGIEAISLYAQHQEKISLVLMDIMMPLMDGLTASSILQQMNSQVKIIGLSGITLDHHQLNTNGDYLSINVFLIKPYTFSELLDVIRNLLKEPLDSMQ